jgi:hypothetical protein
MGDPDHTAQTLYRLHEFLRISDNKDHLRQELARRAETMIELGPQPNAIQRRGPE